MRKDITFDRWAGWDTRKSKYVSDANRLLVMDNCYITKGGAIRQRPGIVKVADLETGTKGLVPHNNYLNTFTNGTPVTHANALFLSHDLGYGATAISEVTDSDVINNNIFLSATLADQEKQMFALDTHPEHNLFSADSEEFIRFPESWMIDSMAFDGNRYYAAIKKWPLYAGYGLYASYNRTTWKKIAVNMTPSTGEIESQTAVGLGNRGIIYQNGIFLMIAQVDKPDNANSVNCHEVFWSEDGEDWTSSGVSVDYDAFTIRETFNPIRWNGNFFYFVAETAIDRSVTTNTDAYLFFSTNGKTWKSTAAISTGNGSGPHYQYPIATATQIIVRADQAQYDYLFKTIDIDELESGTWSSATNHIITGLNIGSMGWHTREQKIYLMGVLGNVYSTDDITTLPTQDYAGQTDLAALHSVGSNNVNFHGTFFRQGDDIHWVGIGFKSDGYTQRMVISRQSGTWSAATISETEFFVGLHHGGAILAGRDIFCVDAYSRDFVNWRKTLLYSISGHFEYIGGKLFYNEGDSDKVLFSATNELRDFSTLNDAGYLPVGTSQKHTEFCTGLTTYQGYLVVCFPRSLQLWRVDPDPTLMYLEKVVHNIGTKHVKASQELSGDRVFLSDRGFRTVTTVSITGNLSDGDIGSPIDGEVTPILENIDSVRSVYFDALGQYWCAVNYSGQCDVFVFTYSKTDKINAWSRYRFTGITDIDDFAELNGNVYFRSGNAVYRVDLDATDDDGTPFSFQVTTPFLDFKKSGSMKNIGGLDYVIAGACTVSLNTPTETNAESLTIDNTADENSSGHKLLAAIQLLTTDVQVNITGTSTSEPFQLDELTFYYDDLGNV